MEYLRTPDERFDDLPGYAYPPSYVEVGGAGLRMHYVARGPRDAPPILLLHGEPTWSYLYRTMIPILAEAHYRPIAPDLIGFGRSDKPVRREDYTIERHVDWLERLVVALDLQKVTLVGQDWGGALGLALVVRQPERFARIIVANTLLATGEEPLPEALQVWRAFAATTPELPIGRIVQSGCTTELPARVIAAYDAPFPDESYKAGAREFPALVPERPDDPGAVLSRQVWTALDATSIPVHTAFSDRDMILGRFEATFRQKLQGAQHDAHTVIHGGGHFLQEDRGPELARAVLDFVQPVAARR